nr:GAP family protein [Kribbella shirazensis]
MWPVVGAVLPQALAIALSPVPLVCILLTLMSPRPVRAALCFAVGWYCALAVATTLVAALTDTVADYNEETARDGVDVIRLAVGVLFAVLAVRYWRARPEAGEPPNRPRIFDRISTLSAGGLVVTGAVAALANLKNLPLVLSAGSYIGATDLAAGSTIAASLAFVTAASLTVLLPIPVVLLVGAARITPALKSLETWLLTNLNTITAGILVLIAVVLISQSL